MRAKGAEPYIRIQRNFFIRKQDRELWAKAKRQAEDEDKKLYEIITKLLREWVKE